MPALPWLGRPVLLELDLTEAPVPDPNDPIARLRARGRRRLRPTLRALHEAADDRRVVGLLVRVGGVLPWATMEELQLGVRAFVASGKPAVAWAETFGELTGNLASYVLATASPEIWLQPSGEVGPLGVSVEATFIRGALDRLGIEPQLEQRYEYKNGADQVVRTGLTPEHRESLERLTRSVFDEAIQAIARGRGLDPDTVRTLIDTGPRTAPEARQVGLVDQLGYRDEVYHALQARVGGDAELLFADRWRPLPKPRLPLARAGHVALVEARGTIAAGRSRRSAGGDQLGSDSIGAELRAAADDDRARALVLHIDSPGGSAVASDSIWREVLRVRESGKPVVVSMGPTAASGGYYIACPADVIVALPSTLTGSIGVLGGKLVVRELLDRLGISTGSVQQGERSLMFSTRRRFTADEQARFAATVDAVYADFVAKVAAGRRRTVGQIEAVARGRVWTGRDALAVGLVDELGGFRDAVGIARTRAGLPEDAPVVRALRVPLRTRLRPARNSADPRAVASLPWPVRSDLSALGLVHGVALQMPPLTLR